MEKRNIKFNLDTIKEWYNSENEILKQLALQVFLDISKKQLPKRDN